MSRVAPSVLPVRPTVALRHFDSRLAGQALFIVGVVGEGHPHLDGLYLLAGSQGVGGAGSAADFGLPPSHR